MQAYESRLKSLGKQIDVHWFEAGHGSQAQEQQLEHQEYRLRFAYQVLRKQPFSTFWKETAPEPHRSS